MSSMGTDLITKQIAILGAGPSGLFIFKRLIESGRADFTISIFEASNRLGEGFPYSSSGANNEHITNVSGNELPELEIPLSEWIKTVPSPVLKSFDIDPDNFNDYKVLPRLLFGKYLAAQFDLLQKKATRFGIDTVIHFNSSITDIIDQPEENKISILVNDSDTVNFTAVIICTGHHWPFTYETKVPGYFDSPYPPNKLTRQFNHTVAIRGASLTAIDAIRTLSRQHGAFIRKENGQVSYHLNDDAQDFKLVMHSRNGMLPAIRFHLEDSHLSKDKLLSSDQIAEHIKNNDGFLSLDFIFEKDFRDIFRKKDPAFYERIREMKVEDFVNEMMSLREKIDAFDLFKGEYAEAAKSIRRKESIYWKEMLAILSFALNYPAKHLSAEDMLRLQKVLMPLIAIVIAFVPQSSCEELIALYDDGILSLVDVGPDNKIIAKPEGGIIYQYRDTEGNSVEKYFATFIDSIGQPHLSLDHFPFKTLVTSGVVSPARLKFRSALIAKELLKDGNANIETTDQKEFYLRVSGLAINDYFQALDNFGAFNERLYIMAVPYIGGFNPDYSGLDFCEKASKIIVERLLKNLILTTD